MKGLGLEFIFGNAVPVLCEVSVILSHSCFAVFCSLICWEVFYSVEIFGVQALRVKCNYVASILIKGFLAAWER